jgi:hypothetical protein
VPRYIFAQIFGSFLAGLILGQYHPQLTLLAAKFRSKGLSPNSLRGPGSVLSSFPTATEINYGYLFFIEFVFWNKYPDLINLTNWNIQPVDSFIG